MMHAAAVAALLAAGALSAAAVLWTFRRLSDQAKVGAAKRQIKASLYEMRLFVDEPGVLLRAQKRLLGANLRYLVLMLPPLLVVAGPLFLMMSVLEAVYGYGPLHSGEAATVTAYLAPSVDLRTASPALAGTPDIAVETPGVRLPAERRVYWRIRPTRDGAGHLVLSVNGSAERKSVRSNGGFAFVSRQRVRSLWDWLLSPTEKRLPSGPVERIEVAYPEAGVSAFGITLPWLAWFMLAGLIGAIWAR